MKPGARLILGTGISGCGRKEIQEELVPYAAARDKKIRIFNGGDMMYEEADKIGLELSRNNILNEDPDVRLALRAAVYNRILSELSADQESDAAFVNFHVWFYQNDIFQVAYDPFRSQFAADMYLTFIDDFRRIHDRLKSREQWLAERLTHAKVLLWQNIEVEVTASWAADARKPFYAVATGQPVSTLYKLVFHPEIEPVYIAMPISHFRAPEQRAKVDEFIERLDKYFTVFNPLSVEIVGAMTVDDVNDDEKSCVANHVVHRDLYWFVRKSNKIIVLWPGAIPSPGVDHETHEAFVKGKDVWVVYLGKELSPFIHYYNTKFFKSEEDFFSFLDTRYPERKGLVW